MVPLTPLAPFQCFTAEGSFEMSVEEKAEVVECRTLEKMSENGLSYIHHVVFSGQSRLYRCFICTQTEYLQVSRFVTMCSPEIIQHNEHKQTFFLGPYFTELGRVFLNDCSDSCQSSHMQEIIPQNTRP